MTRQTTLLTLTRAWIKAWTGAYRWSWHWGWRKFWKSLRLSWAGFMPLRRSLDWKFCQITSRLRLFYQAIAHRAAARSVLSVLALLLLGLNTACSRAIAVQPERSGPPVPLNSRYTDEQPALSGNGQYVAFVSNRKGDRGILLYDLKRQQFVDLPRLNRWDAVAEHPSLSNTARYIVYVASGSGRPEVELYDRVTKQAQVLTSGYRGWVRNPSISPDGRYVAFELGRDGKWTIQVLDRGPGIEPDLLDG